MSLQSSREQLIATLKRSPEIAPAWYNLGILLSGSSLSAAKNLDGDGAGVGRSTFGANPGSEDSSTSPSSVLLPAALLRNSVVAAKVSSPKPSSSSAPLAAMTTVTACEAFCEAIVRDAWSTPVTARSLMHLALHLERVAVESESDTASVAVFAAAGVPALVCPVTSLWSSDQFPWFASSLPSESAVEPLECQPLMLLAAAAHLSLTLLMTNQQEDGTLPRGSGDGADVEERPAVDGALRITTDDAALAFFHLGRLLMMFSAAAALNDNRDKEKTPEEVVGPSSIGTQLPHKDDQHQQQLLAPFMGEWWSAERCFLQVEKLDAAATTTMTLSSPVNRQTLDARNRMIAALRLTDALRVFSNHTDVLHTQQQHYPQQLSASTAAAVVSPCVDTLQRTIERSTALERLLLSHSTSNTVGSRASSASDLIFVYLHRFEAAGLATSVALLLSMEEGLRSTSSGAVGAAATTSPATVEGCVVAESVLNILLSPLDKLLHTLRETCNTAGAALSSSPSRHQQHGGEGRRRPSKGSEQMEQQQQQVSPTRQRHGTDHAAQLTVAIDEERTDLLSICLALATLPPALTSRYSLEGRLVASRLMTAIRLQSSRASTTTTRELSSAFAVVQVVLRQWVGRTSTSARAVKAASSATISLDDMVALELELLRPVVEHVRSSQGGPLGFTRRASQVSVQQAIINNRRVPPPPRWRRRSTIALGLTDLLGGRRLDSVPPASSSSPFPSPRMLRSSLLRVSTEVDGDCATTKHTKSQHDTQPEDAAAALNSDDALLNFLSLEPNDPRGLLAVASSLLSNSDEVVLSSTGQRINRQSLLLALVQLCHFGVDEAQQNAAAALRHNNGVGVRGTEHYDDDRPFGQFGTDARQGTLPPGGGGGGGWRQAKESLLYAEIFGWRRDTNNAEVEDSDWLIHALVNLWLPSHMEKLRAWKLVLRTIALAGWVRLAASMSEWQELTMVLPGDARAAVAAATVQSRTHEHSSAARTLRRVDVLILARRLGQSLLAFESSQQRTLVAARLLLLPDVCIRRELSTVCSMLVETLHRHNVKGLLVPGSQVDASGKQGTHLLTAEELLKEAQGL